MSPIAPWHVYFVAHCRHAKPQPKDKFVVIMCIDSDPCGFFVNSKINQYIYNNAYLLPCEVKLSSTYHSFLAYDSWLDCRDIYRFYQTELTQYRGIVHQSARQDILSGVKNCKVLAKRYKRLIATQAIM
jgi:hypothetical protein